MGKKTKAVRPLKVKPSKEQLAGAARQILDVSLAGTILKSVAEFLARDLAKTPLSIVIAHAENHLQQQAWRKQIAEML